MVKLDLIQVQAPVNKPISNRISKVAISVDSRVSEVVAVKAE